MAMTKILITLPDELVSRMRAAIPPRQRSAVFRTLIQREVQKREQKLYQATQAVETDQALNKDLQAWDITTDDGLEDESW